MHNIIFASIVLIYHALTLKLQFLMQEKHKEATIRKVHAMKLLGKQMIGNLRHKTLDFDPHACKVFEH